MLRDIRSCGSVVHLLDHPQDFALDQVSARKMCFPINTPAPSIAA
jgi:hypothetical protein